MIPIFKNQIRPKVIEVVNDCLLGGELGSSSIYEKKCREKISEMLGTRVLMTASASQALEVAALLAPFEPGAEAIFSAYSFPSTVNPFVYRGFVPVLTEIDQTGCMTPEWLRKAISPQSKVVVVTNYAGQNPYIEKIASICRECGLFLIEDNAQGFLSEQNGHFLGCYGNVGILSFESSKPVSCGEGGAILINDVNLWNTARILVSNGTSKLLHHDNPKIPYTWNQAGLNCTMDALVAAVLYGQLQYAQEDCEKRRSHVKKYLENLERTVFERQKYSSGWNAGQFHVLAPKADIASLCRQKLLNNGIQALSHYGSLRCSPFGRTMRYYGNGESEKFDQRLIRLPLYPTLTQEQIQTICNLLRITVEQKK